MNRTLRRILALLPVAVLALILTLLLSRGEPARAMLQDSPPGSPVETPLATFTPVNPVESPTPGFPALEPPTSVPLPEQPGASPTPKGFLPAPTIVNPDDVKSLPLAQPAVSNSGPGVEPTSTPAPARSAGLRAAVEFLNYLWLLCGGALLIGGAVAIILLWRRGQRS